MDTLDSIPFNSMENQKETRESKSSKNRIRTGTLNFYIIHVSRLVHICNVYDINTGAGINMYSLPKVNNLESRAITYFLTHLHVKSQKGVKS